MSSRRSAKATRAARSLVGVELHQPAGDDLELQPHRRAHVAGDARRRAAPPRPPSHRLASAATYRRGGSHRSCSLPQAGKGSGSRPQPFRPPRIFRRRAGSSMPTPMNTISFAGPQKAGQHGDGRQGGGCGHGVVPGRGRNLNDISYQIGSARLDGKVQRRSKFFPDRCPPRRTRLFYRL